MKTLKEIWKCSYDYEKYKNLPKIWVSNLGNIKTTVETCESFFRNDFIIKKQILIEKKNYQTMVIIKPKFDKIFLNYITLYYRGLATRFFIIKFLVARLFLENEDCKKYVKHKNNNQRDDSVLNLEWCDYYKQNY